MKHSISSKIQNAVLRGRAVLERRQPTKAESITPSQARQNLGKFAELLTRLGDSRDELDASQRIVDETKEQKKEDITEAFLKTGEIPKPGERYKPTSVGLGQYRTRPLSSWERKHTLGNDDVFDPRHIAGWIGRGIEHLDAVENLTAEDLMIS